MTKIKLGAAPKKFSKDLSFPMLDGTVGTMQVIYKYRSRSDFAAFVDAIVANIKADGEAQIAASKEKIAAGADAESVLTYGLSETEMAQKKGAKQADFIMGIVEGWNLDVPFDRAAVEQLVDELPLAAETIVRSYREAITEGRLGN
jgi:hypothetical protein